MKIGDILEVTQEYVDWYGDNALKVPVSTRCIVTAIHDTGVEARAGTRIMPAIPLGIAQRMFVPTIADVWDAFVLLSAAWDAKHPLVDGRHLYIKIYDDFSGFVAENINTDYLIPDMNIWYWDDLADAVVKINAARAGLGAG